MATRPPCALPTLARPLARSLASHARAPRRPWSVVIRGVRIFPASIAIPLIGLTG